MAYFCLVEGLTPNRSLDPNSSLQQKLLEEQLCMRFCAALVEDRNLKPSTIATYFGQLQGWHSKEHGIKLCAGLKLNRLPAMIKGLRRILGDTPQAILLVDIFPISHSLVGIPYFIPYSLYTTLLPLGFLALV